MATKYSQEYNEKTYGNSPSSIWSKFTKPRVDELITWAKSRGLSVFMTSGFRAGEGSDHGKGWAADIGASDKRHLYGLYAWLTALGQEKLWNEYKIKRLYLSLHNYHIHLSLNPEREYLIGYEVKLDNGYPWNDVRSYDVIPEKKNLIYTPYELLKGLQCWNWYGMTIDYALKMDLNRAEKAVEEKLPDKTGMKAGLIAFFAIFAGILIMITGQK